VGIKEYIEIDGLICKEGGWSEEEYANFMDNIIEVVESYGAQMAGSFKLKSEEDLEKN
jgi:hypothetical protein